jgi:hypothetical protein
MKMKYKLRGLFLLMVILLLACRFSTDRGVTNDHGGDGVPLPPDEDYGVSCFVEFADMIVASAPVFDVFYSRDGGLTWQREVESPPGISGSDCTPNKKPPKELWVTPDGLIRYRFDPGKSIEISTDSGKRWALAYDLAGIKWEPVSTPEPERNVVVQPGPLDAMIDPISGNVLLAMGHAGVLVGLPSGEWRWVSVGQYENPEIVLTLIPMSEESVYEDIKLPTFEQIAPGFEIDTENNYVDAMVFSPDGAQLAISGFGGGIKLFGFPNGELQHWLQWGTDSRYSRLYGAVFSQDGETLITCGTNVDQTLKFWDVRNWELISQYEGYQTSALDTGVYKGEAYFSIAFNENPNSSDQVRIFPLGDHTLFKTLDSQDGRISSLKFIPGTQYLAVGSASGGVAYWDFINGERLFLHQPVLETDDRAAIYKKVVILGFDRSANALLAIFGDGTLKAFDVDTGELAWQLALSITHGWHISNVAFSQDGNLAAVGMHNGPLLLFDSKEGAVLSKQWIYDAGTLMQVAFSPDDQWLAAGFSNGRVKVWQITQLID